VAKSALYACQMSVYAIAHCRRAGGKESNKPFAAFGERRLPTSNLTISEASLQEESFPRKMPFCFPRPLLMLK
jgi:hypothetical protein